LVLKISTLAKDEIAKTKSKYQEKLIFKWQFQNTNKDKHTIPKHEQIEATSQEGNQIKANVNVDLWSQSGRSQNQTATNKDQTYDRKTNAQSNISNIQKDNSKTKSNYHKCWKLGRDKLIKLIKKWPLKMLLKWGLKMTLKNDAKSRL
jgi:hypothetical protein